MLVILPFGISCRSCPLPWAGSGSAASSPLRTDRIGVPHPVPHPLQLTAPAERVPSPCPTPRVVPHPSVSLSRHGRAAPPLPPPFPTWQLPPPPLPRGRRRGGTTPRFQPMGRGGGVGTTAAPRPFQPMGKAGSAGGSQWRRGLAWREAAARDGGRGREELAGPARYVRAEAAPGRAPCRALPAGTAEGTGGVNVPPLPSYTPSLYLRTPLSAPMSRAMHPPRLPQSPRALVHAACPRTPPSPCPHVSSLFSSHPRSALIHQQQRAGGDLGVPWEHAGHKPKLLSRESQEAEKPLRERSGAPGSGSAAAGTPPEPE